MACTEEKAVAMSIYKYLVISLFLLLLGYSLMSVGPSSEVDGFRSEIFNPLNITIAPLIVLLGYAVGMLSIFKGKDIRF